MYFFERQLLSAPPAAVARSFRFLVAIRSSSSYCCSVAVGGVVVVTFIIGAQISRCSRSRSPPLYCFHHFDILLFLCVV